VTYSLWDGAFLLLVDLATGTGQESPHYEGTVDMTITQPRLPTVKRLFAVSKNRCAFPTCPAPLVDPSGTIVGHICHIKGKRNGPRYDGSQTDEDRHGFENLILMCSPHHKVVDSDATKYSVKALQEMKREHEDRTLDHDQDDVAVGLLANSGFAGDVTQVAGDRGINIAAKNSSVVIGPAAQGDSRLLAEKRIGAAQQLWKAVLALHNAAPAVLFSRLDIVTEAEYPQQRTRYRDLVDRIDDAVVMAMISPSESTIEEQVPFIDRHLWERFVAYRAFLGRVCMVTTGRVGNGLHWTKEPITMQLLTTAIGPDRIAEMSRLPVGRLSASWSCFQADILDGLRTALDATQR
jgi:hypothetical protein